MSTMTVNRTLLIAITHQQAGRLAEAEALYRQVLAMEPQNPDALHLLGLLAHQIGRHDAAADLISQAILRKANDPAYHSNLGDALRALGRLEEAIACYRRALAIRPSSGVHNELGNVFYHQGATDQAIACYEQALVLQSDNVDALNNLGNALAKRGDMDSAVVSFERALALQPDYPDIRSNLAHARVSQGRIAEAMADYRRAVALAPDESVMHSNLLFALHADPSCDKETLLAEHRDWDARHGQPRRRFQQPHENVPTPNRRLKIGYVSPDLYDHPVGRFLLPLLQNHDHERFEIFCYADIAKPDSVTERLQAFTNRWRITAPLSEEQMTEQVRADRIDILVDLALHTGKNRLTVFARKPAPVQVTWLGLPGTTGLDAMDYRLTDPYLDPPGLDRGYPETSVRLPDTFWCYQAPEGAPEVSPPPALDSGIVTFGCRNKFRKVNAGVLALWARLLTAVPGSQLLLRAPEGSTQARVREIMAQHSIGEERVQFAGHVPAEEYYAQYAKIDIALDTFPYAGWTTTCDTLWMGVPVVSLVGDTPASHSGLSVFSNIGLPELVAHSEDEYIEITADLAADLPRLAELHEGMRARMLASPLMDAPRFARNMESAYRAMWKTWCKKQTKSKAKP